MALAISYALESFGLVYLASPTATAPPSFLLLEPAGHPTPPQPPPPPATAG